MPVSPSHPPAHLVGGVVGLLAALFSLLLPVAGVAWLASRTPLAGLALALAMLTWLFSPGLRRLLDAPLGWLLLLDLAAGSLLAWLLRHAGPPLLVGWLAVLLDGPVLLSAGVVLLGDLALVRRREPRLRAGRPA